MKLIIDINEIAYKNATHIPSIDWNGNLLRIVNDALQNGTPIPVPDNAINERMVGSWIKSRDSYGTNHFTCPFCEHDIVTRNADNWDDNYCSNCGARMEGMEYEKGYIL